jgi:hypothetical protein
MACIGLPSTTWWVSRKLNQPFHVDHALATEEELRVAAKRAKAARSAVMLTAGIGSWSTGLRNGLRGPQRRLAALPGVVPIYRDPGSAASGHRRSSAARSRASGSFTDTLLRDC